ncbi:unnamed protein product [Fusarium graminearum]|nr:unnamed protein product [Fusarium graminearum]
MDASEPDPPSQPHMRNTNSGQPSESFSYEHRRKLQNRLAQRRYRSKLKSRIDVGDEADDDPCQEHTLASQERNTPVLLGAEDIALESCMNITDDLLQAYQGDWDTAECFDDMDNFTETMQCNQDLMTYQEQGQLNNNPNALVSPSDNNVLQNGVHLTAHNQAQRHKCRVTADQNSVTGAEVPYQRHLPERTVSSSGNSSNTNCDGSTADGTRGMQDLSPQRGTGQTGRRAGNIATLKKLLSEDPSCSQKTTGPVLVFQSSNHQENHTHPRHRSRTWSIGSSKQPSSISYQEKLTTKANKLFSDLSQLYKFGVELDMIHYDEEFLQDLSTVKDRFRQLVDPGLADLDHGCDDDTDQCRAKPVQHFDAHLYKSRRITERQHQQLEIDRPNPDPRDSTTKATFTESDFDRYRHDIPHGQGNSRVSTGHSSPRWTPPILPGSTGGSSLRSPAGLKRMHEYRPDNRYKAGSRHEN